MEAIGVTVGSVETVRSMFAYISGDENAENDLKFWNRWFFGHIPWTQRTLSPASQLNDPDFEVWFDTGDTDS